MCSYNKYSTYKIYKRKIYLIKARRKYLEQFGIITDISLI